MKVEKIKITKELIDIKEGKPYEEIIVDGLDQIITEEEIKDYQTTAVRVPYKVVEICSATTGNKYLVRVDELGIFNELWKININEVQGLVHIKTQLLEINTTEQLLEKIKEIKSLPFWKRLFNKF